MLVRVVSCLILALLVSGCITSGPEGPDPSPPIAEDEPPRTTRTLRLDHTAEAGEWLMVWAPFKRHASSYRIGGEESFETAGTGDPDLAFFSRIHSVNIAENQTHWGGWGSSGMKVHASDSAIESNIRYQATMHTSSSQDGLFAFYSANVPWTLQIDIELEDARLLEPQVTKGQDASFHYGGEREHDLRLPIGEVELSAETEGPGWTHIEFLYKRFQPNSEREIEIRFADGFEISDTTTTSGYCLVVMCSGGSRGPGEQFGVINNTAGENLGRAAYREAGYGLDVAIVHLPGAGSAFPPEFNVTDYERWGWPFTSFVPPPP